MDAIRKPFQGVWNIIRFNWHFYALAVGFIASILSLFFIFELDAVFSLSVSFLIATLTFSSLLVSYYVYDASDLYRMDWLNLLSATEKNSKIINIHAGFDETSILLKHRFPDAEIEVFDFYDPAKHTEISIKRARKAYLPFPNTQGVNTSKLPLPDSEIDKVFLIMAAHEIRNEHERLNFFKELERALTDKGQIIVIEHLRDLPNFLAYNIGFFHFISKSAWHRTFEKVRLKIHTETKITPFVTCYILEKHGATP